MSLLLVLALSQVPSLDFDPLEYRSPNGTWRLEVDPTERSGAGAADYRCWNQNRLVWSGRLPFALHHACVTEAGRVIGCASTLGEHAGGGELLAAVIETDGRARVVAKADQHPPQGPHGSSSPTVRGPWLYRASVDGASGAAMIFMTDPSSKLGDSSWTIDLASGELVASVAGDLGAWAGRTWTPQPSPALQPRAAVIELDTRDAPRVVLAHLADVPIATVEWVASLAIADDGAFAVLDHETNELRIHASDGSATGVARSALPRPWSWWRVDSLPNDRWRVQAVRLSRVFDTAGTEVERCPRIRSWSGRELRVWSGETRDWTWHLRHADTELIDPSGAIATTFERRADRRWLGHLSDLVFDADGNVIVVEERTQHQSPPRTALHVLAPLGEPLEQWDLPFVSCSAISTLVHATGRRIVLCGESEGPLVLDRDSGRVWRVVLESPQGVRNVRDAVPARDGTELWVVRERTDHIERYELPAELDRR